eukprot:XP_015576069.1 uncharacterized protein LOC8283686 isoform X1 [Ricinus communis]
MTDNGRVHPDCVNASNPYHECGVACLEKIAQGQGWKEKKKSDYRNGTKGGGLGKKMDGEKRGNSNCPKASNPFHQCDKFCSYRTTEANSQGVNKESGSFILDTSLSFGRKKKGSESQPRSPKVANNVSAAKAVYPADLSSPRSPFPTKKKVESDNGHSSSSSRQHSEESYSQDHSFDKGQVLAPELVPVSGNLKPDGPKNLSLGSFTCFAIAPPTEQDDKEKSPLPGAIKNVEITNGRSTESLNFTFSGISRATEGSDDEEILSVISDSCVSVGKYHVRANSASILQSIIDKYGDIAANCRLESTSLRTYYLECLCSVVQELQSTSLNQLTKSKVRELLAVLKDVESAQIDVSWLRSILNGLTEAVELNNKQQAAEEAKTNCDHVIESTRKELESMVEELGQKEQAVANTKARIEEISAHLSELELESSELSDTILSLRSKIDNFHSKPLRDQIL